MIVAHAGTTLTRFRRGAGLIVVIALGSGTIPAAASSVVAEGRAETPYLLRHLRSNQFLAPDGWGPSVLASHVDGAIAQWTTVDQAGGTVAFRNTVTGQYLSDAVGKNGHEVATSEELSTSTSWHMVDTAAGVQILAGGDYLVADGPVVRMSNRAGAHAEWELIEVQPEASHYVTLTNVKSDQMLSVTGPGDNGLVVTTNVAGLAPATARWRLIEQVSTSRNCGRHTSSKVPSNSVRSYGDTSRVTRCHVLLSRVTGRALSAESSDNDYAVTTTEKVTAHAYWILSDIVADVPVTLLSAEFDRYLTDIDGDARTAAAARDARAQWIISEVSDDCADLTGVRIDSHQSGQTVDTTSRGTATGSFVLYGVAPQEVSSVTIEAAGEIGSAQLERSQCNTGWSIEVGTIDTITETYTVTASGSSGATVTAINLTVIAPSEDDVLLQPRFIDTPQFHDLLRSYEVTTGILVFEGDVSGELAAGDGLGGGESSITPDGYLRIARDVEFDGENTIVSTRQAGLTEFVRQIHISIDGTTRSPTEPAGASAAQPLVEPSEIDAGRQRTAPLDASVTSTGLGPKAAALPIGQDLDLTLEFNVDPDASFELDIDWERPCRFCPIPLPHVEVFSFEVRLNIEVETELVYTGGELITLPKEPFGPDLDDFVFARITVPTPSGIPLIVVFEADSQPFYQVSIDAAARVQLDAEIELLAGFEYKRDGTGRGGYRSGDVDGAIPSLNLDFGISLTAAVGVEVDIEAQLYGQAGIELEASPQLEFEAFGDIVDREVPWELKLVVPFAAGLDIEIDLGPFEWEKEFGEIEFLELSLIIAKGTWFGDGGDDGDDDDEDGGKDTQLVGSISGPPGVSAGEDFDFTIVTTNAGTATAEGVIIDLVLPDTGSFVSSSPFGTPASPSPSTVYRIDVGLIPAGESETATVRWRAPDDEAVLSAVATIRADNASDIGPFLSSVNTLPPQTPLTVSVSNAFGVDYAFFCGGAVSRPVTFPVTLSRASDADVTVRFGTVDGTAVSGLDYVATSGSITIPAGSLRASVVVEVIPDAPPFDFGEYFTLHILESQGAAVLRGIAVGQILDDVPCVG